MSTGEMKVVAASISGGYFPHQLRLLHELMLLGYKPDIALGCSGGNVALYLAQAAGWDPYGLNRVARSINSRFFVESWFPSSLDFIPSLAAGLFAGAAYRKSEHAIRLFNAYFTPADVVETEIWVGAINEKSGSIRLFCNRSYEDAIIKGKHYNLRMFKSDPLKYLNGNVEHICQASVASSSIPLIIDPQKIDGREYVDGGTKFASPLSPLQDELTHLAEKHGGIHIIYINGYNVEQDLKDKPVSIIDRGRNATSLITRGFVLHDRTVAYTIIRGTGRVTFADVQSCALSRVYDLISKCKSSLLELFPLVDSSIDYTNFNGDDVIHVMEQTSRHFAGHLWWTGDDNIFDNIEGVHVHHECREH